MIASLPMYAFAHTAEANGRLWTAIRDGLRQRGVDAPDRLTLSPGDLLAHWMAPDLILSQTCGRPYKDHLHGKVRLVGTPDYGLTDCPPGHYHSLVVARADDPRNSLSDYATGRFAFNDPGSQSGWAALAAEAPDVLTGPKVLTGGHRDSVHAVQTNLADFAAIDAVTLRHLTAASEATDLKVIHGTAPRPGLPLITSRSQTPDLIRDAVTAAIAGLTGSDRERLGLKGLVDIPDEAYLALPDPQASAE